ncbi:MAG: hypothetical protein AAF664_12425 [Planctomycetota bacterium]
MTYIPARSGEVRPLQAMFAISSRGISMEFLRRLIDDEQATSAVEYAVLLSLIVVVCLVAITAIGESAYDAMWDVVEILE